MSCSVTLKSLEMSFWRNRSDPSKDINSGHSQVAGSPGCVLIRSQLLEKGCSLLWQISYCDKFSTSLICMPCIVLLHNFGTKSYREYIPERSTHPVLYGYSRSRSVLPAQAQDWVLHLPAPSFGIWVWHCAYTQHQLNGASRWLSLCGTWNGNSVETTKCWFGNDLEPSKAVRTCTAWWIMPDCGAASKIPAGLHYSVLALGGWVPLISHLQFLRLK